MNYLKELVAFSKAVEIERISPNEQALWFALMNIANGLGWPDEFTVAVLTLQSKSSLTEREIYRARNRMVQRGLITVTSRGSNKAAVYSINSNVKTDDLSDTLSDSMSGTLSDSMSGSMSDTLSDTMSGTLSVLNKLNKTKLNPKPPISPRSDGALFDAFWTAYPRKVAKEAARKAFAKHKPDDTLLTTMLSALETQKASDQWARDNGQYIPHASTWLNQKRWEDEGTIVLPGTNYEEDVQWA